VSLIYVLVINAVTLLVGSQEEIWPIKKCCFSNHRGPLRDLWDTG